MQNKEDTMKLNERLKRTVVDIIKCAISHAKLLLSSKHYVDPLAVCISHHTAYTSQQIHTPHD